MSNVTPTNPSTIKARPIRTADSAVWNGVAARDITSSRPIFRWTPDQTEKIQTFIRESYPNARTSGDWNALLVQLNLDGYNNIRNTAGDNVGEIIRTKVKQKLYREEKKMKDEGEELGRSADGIHSMAAKESAKLGAEYETFGSSPSFASSSSYQASSPLAVATAAAPPFGIMVANIGANWGSRRTTPSSQTIENAQLASENTGGQSTYCLPPSPPEAPALSFDGDGMHREYITEHLPRRFASTASRGSLFNRPGHSRQSTPQSTTTTEGSWPHHQGATPQLNGVPSTLKMPRGTSISSEYSSEAAGPKIRPMHTTAGKHDTRRSKADRILQAWTAFHEELLNVAQEPDGQEDGELCKIVDYMVHVSQNCLHDKGVRALLDLAEKGQLTTWNGRRDGRPE